MKNNNNRHDIEIARIISAFSIICFHSGVKGTEIFYAGLIVFIAISIYLASRTSQTGILYLTGISKRLLVPWVFWIITYGVFNLLMGRTIVPLENGLVSGILTGSSVHLWFIPFLFICLALYSYLKKYILGHTIAVVAATLAIAMFASASIWRLKSIEYGSPIAQYFHALPGLFFSIYFANFKSLRAIYYFPLLALIVVAAILAIQPLGLTYLVGIPICLFLYKEVLHNLRLSWLTMVSNCMLGVYFLHVIVLNILRKINFSDGMLLPITVFSLSLLMVYLARKFMPRLSKYWS